MTTYGTFVNSGLITNTQLITNNNLITNVLGTITNRGKIINNKTINNNNVITGINGTINNNNVITNNGVICGGVFQGNKPDGNQWIAKCPSSSGELLTTSNKIKKKETKKMVLRYNNRTGCAFLCYK
jgi:hypothetical protein